MKRLSNKYGYGKNSKNNKFHKILHLEREKVKKGFSKSVNLTKIAKVTIMFHAMWKDWATNMAKIARITNLTGPGEPQNMAKHKLARVTRIGKNCWRARKGPVMNLPWSPPFDCTDNIIRAATKISSC